MAFDKIGRRVCVVVGILMRKSSRSTTNIVRAAQKIIESSESGSANDLRQDMKPMRGSGPTPRILACANAKSEGTWTHTHTHTRGKTTVFG